MYSSTLKDLKLRKKTDDFGKERYVLSATYHVDMTYESYDVTYPNIELPLMNDPILRTEFSTRILPDRTIDLGFGELPLLFDERTQFAYRTNVVKKSKKMTLSEIEEKLGHKIELVSEKE